MILQRIFTAEQSHYHWIAFAGAKSFDPEIDGCLKILPGKTGAQRPDESLALAMEVGGVDSGYFEFPGTAVPMVGERRNTHDCGLMIRCCFPANRKHIKIEVPASRHRIGGEILRKTGNGFLLGVKGLVIEGRQKWIYGAQIRLAILGMFRPDPHILVGIGESEREVGPK